MPHNMQISDNAIIDALWGALVLVVGIITRIVWKVTARLFQRLKAVEDKMAHAVTKPQVDEIVAKVEYEFRTDHKGLEGKMERIQESLRKEIHESHDSLQNGIDKVVNILLTRDENDRRRRDD